MTVYFFVGAKCVHQIRGDQDGWPRIGDSVMIKTGEVEGEFDVQDIHWVYQQGDKWDVHMEVTLIPVKDGFNPRIK